MVQLVSYEEYLIVTQGVYGRILLWVLSCFTVPHIEGVPGNPNSEGARTQPRRNTIVTVANTTQAGARGIAMN